jgi:hypothetical protein
MKTKLFVLLLTSVISLSAQSVPSFYEGFNFREYYSLE